MTTITLKIGKTDSKWKEAKNYIVKFTSLGNPDKVQVTKKRNQAAVKVIVHKTFAKV